MAERLLLVDNDVFILLSGAGLLDLAIELLGFDSSAARRLAALPYVLRRSRKCIATYPEDVRHAVLNACDRFRSLTSAPTQMDVYQSLIDVEEIDDGEALLYASLAEREHCMLASGDKRAMRALAGSPSLEHIKQAISGRVICFETVLRLLVHSKGVSRTAEAFAPLRQGNRTLRIVFSNAAATTRGHCLAALNSYLGDLKKDVGEGFLFEP